MVYAILYQGTGTMILKKDKEHNDAAISHASQPILNLDKAEFYRNRELSLLDFNQRVLAQANDPSIPLLERSFSWPSAPAI